MSKKAEKVLLAYLAAQFVHWLFNEAIDEEARKRGWTAAHVEAAKLAVGGLMLVL